MTNVNLNEFEEMAEKIRSQFLYFVVFMNPQYILTPFHRKLIGEIQKLIDGKLTRLAISMPPGHGKSELCSRLLPFYLTLRNPQGKTLAASYGADFGNREFGKPVRKMYDRSKEKLKLIFPDAEIDMKSMNGNYIETTAGGSITYDGWKGGFTGKRATNLFVIDDVIKSSAEARSTKILDEIYDWYYSTALSRLLHDDVPMLMLMTRWSENDLIGRVAAPSPEEWTYINVPVFAVEDDPTKDFIGRQKGEILWEERFTRKYLAEQQKNPYQFSALYQGNPVVDSGNLIPDYHFQEYDKLPKLDRHSGEKAYRFSSWDTGEKDKPDSDPSVRIDWELRIDGMGEMDLYLLDLYMGKPNINELFNLARKKWKEGFAPVIEEASSGVQLVQLLAEEGHEKGIIRISPQGNKIEKLVNSLIYFNDSRMYLPANAEWLPKFKAECKAFPYGTHDDQVDAMRLALQAILMHKRDLLKACRKRMGNASMPSGVSFKVPKKVTYGIASPNGIGFTQIRDRNRKYGRV